MTSLKYISLFIALFMLLVGCSQVNEAVAPLENKDYEESEMKLYINEKEAYTLELPPSWFGVLTKEVEWGGVEFQYPSADTNLQQSFFRIYSMNVNEWENVKDEPSAPTHEIIRHEGKVFLYQTPLDQVLEGEELAEYENMVKDIPQIIKSFSLKQ